MITLLTGDVREVLPTLPDASVQCVVTSPPYYALRSYLDASHPDKHREIGSESTPVAYIATMVGVFREVWRVLRDDGTCWVNMGDSFSGGNNVGWRPGNPDKNGGNSNRDGVGYVPGLAAKQLLMMPARLALALQQDGWWLRSDIIWHKIAPMPESVLDRPTRSHEHVFLLTKSERYFYNTAEAREPLRETSVARLIQPGYEEQAGSERANGGAKTNGRMKAVGAHFGGRIKSKINDQTRLASGNEWSADPASGANWRDVWSIASEGYSGAHFAVMPAALVERCIRAGSRPGDTILDPFSGAGTALLVADRLGRDAIGIDLSHAYVEMAKERLRADCPLFADITDAPVPVHPVETEIADLFAEAAK